MTCFNHTILEEIEKNIRSLEIVSGKKFPTNKKIVQKGNIH